MEKYKDWTRDQLLERLVQLEQNTNGSNATAPPISKKAAKKMKKESKKSKKERDQKPFDMSKYRQRHVAFRVAYLGWRYAGFASQGDEITLPTVEGQLFTALEQTRLIVDRDNCNYSRCGRTDRGVSGLGQVIMINVRSNSPLDPDAPFSPVDQECPYVDMLNRSLPDDIRVLSWAPVADDLNARFDCRSRTYRYLFRIDQHHPLDVQRMREAARYFVGSHDFRNFCKLDPAKNITNYHRTMMACDIFPLDSQGSLTIPEDTTPTDDGPRMWTMQLQGSAFLWHQVRCMMSVLFLVGRGYEAPTIVKDLLDIDKYPGRPEYPLASDLPLIFFDCAYDNPIDWTSCAANTHLPRLFSHLDERCYMEDVRSHTCQLFYQRVVADFPEQAANIGPANDTRTMVVLGGGATSTLHRYRPLEGRIRCHTDEQRKIGYLNRKRKRAEFEAEAEKSA
ncbi:tRNA pseudouridine synthase [Hesseltinella vesiculosa]|uniref:tRNA pseudouridine synthase n=1 Tax=Hesseltinella vesiculosa TaxID=101127 RepID=A0A1X2GUI7_9FUNG|nr:tRNA pseudouridine synthase [Hesseltinella vesiculosa]